MVVDKNNVVLFKKKDQAITFKSVIEHLFTNVFIDVDLWCKVGILRLKEKDRNKIEQVRYGDR